MGLNVNLLTLDNVLTLIIIHLQSGCRVKDVHSGCGNTYNRVFRVNFQDFNEGCVCFTVVVLTEVDKGPGKQTHTVITLTNSTNIYTT